MALCPRKRLRRNSKKCTLFGLVLLFGVVVVAVYHEMVAVKTWSFVPSSRLEVNSWRLALLNERYVLDQQTRPDSAEDSATWRSNFTLQTWSPENAGRANLHVFEDWCGGSVANLRKSIHYPLHPHTRTTVKKLTVSPCWTNYGLRIFGYLHPYADGDFVFAVSSDDNSEFWLSRDDSPLNVKLLAWVGKTGAEWTAPGEFLKYFSQTSRPVWLSAKKKYFFEVLHKQDDKGTDHVEVAWKLLNNNTGFSVIESSHISLYVDESALLLSDVEQIPQTAASHQHTPMKEQVDPVDMKREDPRDTFYKVPLVDSSFFRGVLPDCSYKPTYTIKNHVLQRYEGLQYVQLSYVYPNDYTRLTHMENQDSCFYHGNNNYMRRSGFSRYMKLDRDDSQGNSAKESGFLWSSLMQNEKEQKSQDEMDGAALPDYGDDYDDYAQAHRRKLFSIVPKESSKVHTKAESQTPTGSDDSHRPQLDLKKPVEHLLPARLKNVPKDTLGLKEEEKESKMDLKEGPPKTSRETQTNPEEQENAQVNAQAGSPSKHLGSQVDQNRKSAKKRRTKMKKLKGSKLLASSQNTTVAKKGTAAQQREENVTAIPPVEPGHREASDVKPLGDQDLETNISPQQNSEKNTPTASVISEERTESTQSGEKREESQPMQKGPEEVTQASPQQQEAEPVEDPAEEAEDTQNQENMAAPVLVEEINWSQTFQVEPLDLQEQRSDWIDLNCNVSGNLLLRTRETLVLVQAFMDKLHKKHPGRFSLERVVNVEKRVDGLQGSRYLLELEVKDESGRLLRLSHYVYVLQSRSRFHGWNLGGRHAQEMLCYPAGFKWNPAATVHIIVPVKNQARWVQQLISDMEKLFRLSGDTNFNLIITDYSSTDINVKKALERSTIPRYQYLKLGGNFQRSAGLQAGIDLVKDPHSILFLCDLHIDFPPFIIDSIRKHTVEGHMAFAPIVMRLDCGSTPQEAKGFWEVNGFGLLGIYKSDLDAVGGMNTREYTNSWGGEDWELLDRVLQKGLEVERIYLRNFFHHYHSKRGMWNQKMVSRQT